MQQPTRLISTPFAQEGEKTEIQNVTGEFDNSATYRLGFPPLTMQSIRLGGKPPKGTDFNGVLFDITENISFLCKGGRYQYNAGLSTLIGGYPEGSNLLLDDNVTEVVSTVAGNQNNPNTDMTGWILKPNKTTAVNVADASRETQQQVNYNGGSKWHPRVGGYLENERVVLANGDIVKSTIDGNTNDPNADGTGWFNESNSQRKTVEKAKRDNQTIYDYGAVGDGTLHTVEEWYTPLNVNYRGYADLTAVQADYPFVTDKDFSADQAAILKLSKIKGDAGGGTVDLSQGHYYIKPINNGACLPIPPKVTLKGHREDTILHEHTAIDDDPNTSVYWDLVVFTGELNVGGGINNCTIRHTGGRRNNTASIAVRGGASRKKIFGNIFENTIGSGVVVEYNVNDPKPLSCQVFGNFINPTSRHGVYIIGATANKVFNNDINISALESIAIRAVGNNEVYENNFFGVAGIKAHAITLAAPPAGVGGYKYKGLSIRNNKAFGIRGAFFYGQGVGCQLSESEISGNYINQSIEADVTDHGLMLYRTTNTKIKDNIFDGGRNRGVMLYGCQGNDITGNTLKNLNEAGNSVGLVFCAEYADSYDSTTTYSTSNNIKSNKFIDDRGVQKHAYAVQMLTGSNKNSVSKNAYVGGSATRILSADGLNSQNIGDNTERFLFTKSAMALGTVTATNMTIGGNSLSEYASKDAYIKEFRLLINQVLTAGTVTVRLYKNGSALVANVFTADGSKRTNALYFQPLQYGIVAGDLINVTIESSGTSSGQAQVDASVSVILAE